MSDHWHRPDRLKRCILCGEYKALSEFYAYGYITKQGKASTRYESRCSPCARARRMARYNEIGEMERATSNAWKRANRDHLMEYNARKQQDPDHRAIKAKSQRLRKARMRSGQGDNAAIRAIYDEAMRVEKLIQRCPVFDLPELGKKIHVDHIIPLARGGRHHESNLQLLPIGLNMRKGAK
jgi:5-methylcytosine-specific restriction endonuclease McrA